MHEKTEFLFLFLLRFFASSLSSDLIFRAYFKDELSFRDLYLPKPLDSILEA